MTAGEFMHMAAGCFFGFVACMVIVCLAADWRGGR